MAKKKFDYFKAYKHISELAVEEAVMLLETLQTYTEASGLSDTIEAIHELEHKGDEIDNNIFIATASDFMPPFDREDVVELAKTLDDVLDSIDDVVGALYMYDIRTMPKDALRFGELIKSSTKALDKAMEDFKNFKKSKKFRHLIEDVNNNEEEGDKLFRDAQRYLHTEENSDPMHVLVWSRVYERMETCCNACKHAADVMSTIMMKNM